MMHQRYFNILVISLALCLALTTSGQGQATVQAAGNQVGIPSRESTPIEPAGKTEIDVLLHPQIARLLDPDQADNANFGGSIALGGDTLIVGSASTKGGNSGAAYVFERNKGGADNWGLVKQLLPSTPGADDRFGSPIAIDGDTLVIGANGVKLGGNERGAAYVFERNKGGPNNWGQVKMLTAYDQADFDNFGIVAISGDTIVVGAPRKTVVSEANGVVYIFERNQGGPDNWGFVKKLLDPNMAAYNQFGFGLAIDGDTIVAGAGLEDGGGTNRGASYIFERNSGGPNNWGNVKTLTAAQPEDFSGFGGHADIDGDTLIIGAFLEDAGGQDYGAAYIFERNKGGVDNWGQVQKLTASDSQERDWFGSPVTVHGDNIAVGAYMKDGLESHCGAAYVFSRDQGGANNWGQVQKLVSTIPEEYGAFGVSTDFNGDTIVVGASREDSRRGAAYVYYQTQGQMGYLPLISR